MGSKMKAIIYGYYNLDEYSICKEYQIIENVTSVDEAITEAYKSEFDLDKFSFYRVQLTE